MKQVLDVYLYYTCLFKDTTLKTAPILERLDMNDEESIKKKSQEALVFDQSLANIRSDIILPSEKRIEIENFYQLTIILFGLPRIVEGPQGP